MSTYITWRYVAFFGPKNRSGSDAYVSFAPLIRESGLSLDQVRIICESE